MFGLDPRVMRVINQCMLQDSKREHTRLVIVMFLMQTIVALTEVALLTPVYVQRHATFFQLPTRSSSLALGLDSGALSTLNKLDMAMF